MARPFASAEEYVARFWAKVSRAGPADCWLWTATTNGKYGTCCIGPKRRGYAHRFAYSLSRGPIPEGCVIDHLCRTPLCCNPAHLEPVTPRENTMRGVRGRLYVRTAPTHCRRGHPYAAHGWHIRQGYYQCLACANLMRNARRRAAREAHHAH